MTNTTKTDKIERALATQDYHELTAQEEDEIIRRFPDTFSRDEPIVIDGKTIYHGLFNGDNGCNHLVKALNSGVTCVKCPAWYCA